MNQRQNARPRRLDAYIRVSRVGSREGEKFTSPTDQEKAIRQWAELYGHEITDAGPDNGAWHELDVSGGTMDRPKLNEILARVDAGESDGLVVYRLDRFGRTLVGALQIIERLHDEGKSFASVMDNFDIATENGRLVLRIMLSLAQYERERIETTWRTAKVNAVERGWHLSGRRPFGYRREQLKASSGETYLGGLVIDPDEGPLVTELFRRRAAGEGYGSMARWMDSTGVPTSVGKASWGTHVLQTMFANRVYLGEVSTGVSKKTGRPLAVNAHAHEPLIDPETWRMAQYAGPPKRTPKVARHQALAKAVIRCATCRYVVGIGPNNSNKAQRDESWSYRCQRNGHNRDCTDPANVIAYNTNGEAGVDALIWEQVRDRIRERIGYGVFDDTGDDLELLEAEWLEAQQRLDEHAQNLELEDQLGKAAFGKRGEALRLLVEERFAEFSRARTSASPEFVLGRTAFELIDDDDKGRLTIDDRRLIVNSMVQAIFIKSAAKGSDGRRVPARGPQRLERLRSRFHIVWADEPFVDVPRPGRIDFDPKPFEFTA